MKKRFLKFWHTYRYCFLADFIFLLCFIGSFAIEGFETAGGFSFADIFMIYIIPLYSIIYGIVTNQHTKKVLMPNLILFIIVWLGIPLSNMKFRPSVIFSVQAIVWPCIMVAFSVIFSAFTSLVRSVKIKDDNIK